MADDVPTLTLQVLRDIRDEVRQTNNRLDRLEKRQTETNDGLDRLEKRQAETEIRLSTELVAVSRAVLEVRDLLRQDREIRTAVDDHETRLRALESRTRQ